MRILHIGKYYAPERGGIESQTRDLSQWFVAHGDTVGALVHQRPGVWRTTRESIDGVEICRVACIGSALYTPISPSFPLELRRVLRAFQPDLLHLHLPNPFCFSALLNTDAQKKPWIVHWHSDIPSDAPDWRLRAAYRVYRPFEQALLKRARRIVATSKTYLDASTALEPWRDKVRVIALGTIDVVSPQPRRDLWPSGDGLRLLAVGRLSQYKGFDVLVDALATHADSNLVLIGEGECADDLRARAIERGVANRITFAGGLDDESLLGAYAAADIFVLPSLNRGEAFGIVLLEAMRARLPVIASAVQGSGIGDVVVDGETGFLVAPGNADALCAAIERLRDPALRTRIGAAGRARWERQFTIDESARRWLALYTDLVPPT